MIFILQLSASFELGAIRWPMLLTLELNGPPGIYAARLHLGRGTPSMGGSFCFT